MKLNRGLLVLIGLSLLATAGCDFSGSGSGTSTTPAPAAAPAPIVTETTEDGVVVTAATFEQCPNGGLAIQTFVDLQHDGKFDSGDTLLNTTTICNGTNGTNGLGAGIQVVQATSGACSAGGLQITTFIDANNNGNLDSGEAVTSVNTICNGTNGTNGINGNSFNISQVSATVAQCSTGGTVYTVGEFDGSGHAVAGSCSTSVVCNGANGTNGTNGANGVGMVFTTLSASSAQCADGGSILMMAADTAGTGTYSAADANQQSVTICNGATGAVGPAGPVSPFSPVNPIMPCGAASSPWKEVLLCMADGNILADFSATMSGDMTRLSFIPAGSYEDTDSSGCNFNVNDDGAGGSIVSWGGGSNAYSTWNAGSYDCAATSP